MAGQGVTNAQAGLVAWAQTADDWVRWIVTEVIASGKPLSEHGIEEAYQRVLSEKGLSDETFATVPTLEGFDAEDTETAPLILKTLESCEGVNALATGQKIEFNPRMTVLFGENASGKSGYVRILKRLASGRSEEPILGNIYSSETRQPRARVTYSLGGEDHEFDWSDEAAVAPFTRLAVFDARALTIHLDTDLTYVFTPADLSLFTNVHSAVDAVRTKGDGAVAEARPRANPFLPRFQRGTAAYQQIETLGASTDITALEAHAAVSPDVQDEIQTRRARVEALRPESVVSRLEIAHGDRSLYELLVHLCDDVEKFDVERYLSALTRAQDAAATFDRVTTSAIDVANQRTPAHEMEAFIRAGEVLLTAAGIDAYPSDGDSCIYCTQELGSTALTAVAARRAWVNDESARTRDAAVAEAAAGASSLGRIQVDSLAERVAAKVASAGRPSPVLSAAAVLIDAIREAAESTRSRSQVSWGPVAAAVDALRPLASSALDEAAEVVTALQAQESDRTAAFNAQRVELAELEGRAVLASVLGDVRAFVDRARWADRLGAVLRPVPALLRSLTEAAKSASEEVLNRGFEERFKLEAEMLHAPQIRLDFPGRRGQAARRKMLVPDHRLSEILSEGEQRVIALADFLSEASLRPNASPLIFDDPVNSLDYARLEYVVRRLVQLSEEQQIVVLTHNIWFAVELLNQFEKLPGACSYFDIARSETATGVVTGGSHPRSDTVKHLSGEINALLQDAATMTGESQAALIERAYDKIRAWCEVVVEEEVLQGVTKRYQPNVQMTKLPQIKADRLPAAIASLNELYEKACRAMGGHSQPLETLAVRPSLDEAKKDWAEAQDARKAYIAP